MVPPIEDEAKYKCPSCGCCFVSGKFDEDDNEVYDDVCPWCGWVPCDLNK